jgi:hypothetical protein
MEWEFSHFPGPQSRPSPQPAGTVPPGTGAATIPPPVPPSGDSDAAMLRRLLAASAATESFSTGPPMPNAAPPLHRAARRRVTDEPSLSVHRPGVAAGVPAPASVSSAAPLTPVPASWAGFGALLASTGERAPADALRLAAVAADTTGTAGRVDLSGIWALPAEPAAPRSHELVRALDGKGRLMLPVAVAEATTVPAERDGAVVTVFLPGSTGRPRPGFTAAALPLDARGRLTVTAGVRREAGIPDGADVFAVLDPDRGTVTLTAASRLSAGIAGLLDGLRRPTAAPATPAVDNTACPAASAAAGADATDATDTAPADAGATGASGRLCDDGAVSPGGPTASDDRERPNLSGDLPTVFSARRCSAAPPSDTTASRSTPTCSGPRTSWPQPSASAC